MKWFTTHHVRLMWFTGGMGMNLYLFLHEFLRGQR